MNIFLYSPVNFLNSSKIYGKVSKKKVVNPKLKFYFHRNTTIFFVAAALIFVSAQKTRELQILNCMFSTDQLSEYSCRLEGIEVLDPSKEVVIVGIHQPRLGNKDVLVVNAIYDPANFYYLSESSRA